MGCFHAKSLKHRASKSAPHAKAHDCAAATAPPHLSPQRLGSSNNCDDGKPIGIHADAGATASLSLPKSMLMPTHVVTPRKGKDGADGVGHGDTAPGDEEGRAFANPQDDDPFAPPPPLPSQLDEDVYEGEEEDEDEDSYHPHHADPAWEGRRPHWSSPTNHFDPVPPAPIVLSVPPLRSLRPHGTISGDGCLSAPASSSNTTNTIVADGTDRNASFHTEIDDHAKTDAAQAAREYQQHVQAKRRAKLKQTQRLQLEEFDPIRPVDSFNVTHRSLLGRCWDRRIPELLPVSFVYAVESALQGSTAAAAAVDETPPTRIITAHLPPSVISRDECPPAVPRSYLSSPSSGYPSGRRAGAAEGHPLAPVVSASAAASPCSGSPLPNGSRPGRRIPRCSHWFCVGSVSLEATYPGGGSDAVPSSYPVTSTASPPSAVRLVENSMGLAQWTSAAVLTSSAEARARSPKAAPPGRYGGSWGWAGVQKGGANGSLAVLGTPTAPPPALLSSDQLRALPLDKREQYFNDSLPRNPRFLGIKHSFAFRLADGVSEEKSTKFLRVRHLEPAPGVTAMRWNHVELFCPTLRTLLRAVAATQSSPLELSALWRHEERQRQRAALSAMLNQSMPATGRSDTEVSQPLQQSFSQHIMGFLENRSFASVGNSSLNASFWSSSNRHHKACDRASVNRSNDALIGFSRDGHDHLQWPFGREASSGGSAGDAELTAPVNFPQEAVSSLALGIPSARLPRLLEDPQSLSNAMGVPDTNFPAAANLLEALRHGAKEESVQLRHSPAGIGSPSRPLPRVSSHPLPDKTVLVALCISSFSVSIDPFRWQEHRYIRHPIDLDDTKKASRHRYGEGVVTDVMYGGIMVVECSSPAAVGSLRTLLSSMTWTEGRTLQGIIGDVRKHLKVVPEGRRKAGGGTATPAAADGGAEQHQYRIWRRIGGRPMRDKVEFQEISYFLNDDSMRAEVVTLNKPPGTEAHTQAPQRFTAEAAPSSFSASMDTRGGPASPNSADPDVSPSFSRVASVWVGLAIIAAVLRTWGLHLLSHPQYAQPTAMYLQKFTGIAPVLQLTALSSLHDDSNIDGDDRSAAIEEDDTDDVEYAFFDGDPGNTGRRADSGGDYASPKPVPHIPQYNRFYASLPESPSLATDEPQAHPLDSKGKPSPPPGGGRSVRTGGHDAVPLGGGDTEGPDCTFGGHSPSLRPQQPERMDDGARGAVEDRRSSGMASTAEPPYSVRGGAAGVEARAPRGREAASAFGRDTPSEISGAPTRPGTAGTSPLSPDLRYRPPPDSSDTNREEVALLSSISSLLGSSSASKGTADVPQGNSANLGSVRPSVITTMPCSPSSTPLEVAAAPLLRGAAGGPAVAMPSGSEGCTGGEGPSVTSVPPTAFSMEVGRRRSPLSCKTRRVESWRSPFTPAAVELPANKAAPVVGHLPHTPTVRTGQETELVSEENSYNSSSTSTSSVLMLRRRVTAKPSARVTKEVAGAGRAEPKAAKTVKAASVPKRQRHSKTSTSPTTVTAQNASAAAPSAPLHQPTAAPAKPRRGTVAGSTDTPAVPAKLTVQEVARLAQQTSSSSPVFTGSLDTRRAAVSNTIAPATHRTAQEEEELWQMTMLELKALQQELEDVRQARHEAEDERERRQSEFFSLHRILLPHTSPQELDGVLCYLKTVLLDPEDVPHGRLFLPYLDWLPVLAAVWTAPENQMRAIEIVAELTWVDIPRLGLVAGLLYHHHSAARLEKLVLRAEKLLGAPRAMLSLGRTSRGSTIQEENNASVSDATGTLRNPRLLAWRARQALRVKGKIKRRGDGAERSSESLLFTTELDQTAGLFGHGCPPFFVTPEEARDTLWLLLRSVAANTVASTVWVVLKGLSDGKPGTAGDGGGGLLAGRTMERGTERTAHHGSGGSASIASFLARTVSRFRGERSVSTPLMLKASSMQLDDFLVCPSSPFSTDGRQREPLQECRSDASGRRNLASPLQVDEASAPSVPPLGTVSATRQNSSLVVLSPSVASMGDGMRCGRTTAPFCDSVEYGGGLDEEDESARREVSYPQQCSTEVRQAIHLKQSSTLNGGTATAKLLSGTWGRAAKDRTVVTMVPMHQHGAQRPRAWMREGNQVEERSFYSLLKHYCAPIAESIAAAAAVAEEGEDQVLGVPGTGPYIPHYHHPYNAVHNDALFYVDPERQRQFQAAAKRAFEKAGATCHSSMKVSTAVSDQGAASVDDFSPFTTVPAGTPPSVTPSAAPSPPPPLRFLHSNSVFGLQSAAEEKEALRCEEIALRQRATDIWEALRKAVKHTNQNQLKVWQSVAKANSNSPYRHPPPRQIVLEH